MKLPPESGYRDWSRFLSNNILVVDGPIDCACVIHGNAYAWTYVERLYNMLARHISVGIRLHVYTEAERPVPAPMIKHELHDWNIGGPKKGWWYKMQLFDSLSHAGPLLYFDLDTVIVNNIDWIWQLPLKYFWSVKDFKYLQKHNYQSVNSSIMWWNTQTFDHVWKTFEQQNLEQLIKKYRGDQDYINLAIEHKDQRFLDSTRIQSWRWQCLDGGYDFQRRCYRDPGTGTKVAQSTAVMVFHGSPKPHQTADSEIAIQWR
jgi:hypothetical protein